MIINNTKTKIISFSVSKSQVKSKDGCRESLGNFLKLAEDFDVSLTETLEANSPHSQPLSSSHSNDQLNEICFMDQDISNENEWKKNKPASTVSTSQIILPAQQVSLLCTFCYFESL